MVPFCAPSPGDPSIEGLTVKPGILPAAGQRLTSVRWRWDRFWRVPRAAVGDRRQLACEYASFWASTGCRQRERRSLVNGGAVGTLGQSSLRRLWDAFFAAVAASIRSAPILGRLVYWLPGKDDSGPDSGRSAVRLRPCPPAS